MSVDQEFCKPLDTEDGGAVDRKDKLKPEISVYSWRTNQWLFQERKANIVNLSRNRYILNMRIRIIELSCWQTDSGG